MIDTSLCEDERDEGELLGLYGKKKQKEAKKKYGSINLLR